MITEILQYIGMALMLIGAIFFFLGTLGLVRMPDVYNRMQASTKTTTLGLLSFVLGVGFMDIWWLPKATIIALFVLLTAPIGASALARASIRAGVKPDESTVVNACEEVLKND